MQATTPLSIGVLVRLGRISNLPTVWTNLLAGAVLAGGNWYNWRLGVVLTAISLFYIGGMYLNDYCDRAIDEVERPERPIPSGAIGATTVGLIAVILLGAGLAMMVTMGPRATVIAALLAIAVIAYDFRHKGHAFAPVLMGVCRALVYCAAAATLTSTVSWLVLLAGAGTALYVTGLTYAARQESLDAVGDLWPLLLLTAPLVAAVATSARGPGTLPFVLLLVVWTGAAVYLLVRRPFRGAVSRAVSRLVAGLSVVDAVWVAAVGRPWIALVAIGGFVATVLAQRYVPGT
jgi:4-hydroxybenzoate polyprenyltransferase